MHVNIFGIFLIDFKRQNEHKILYINIYIYNYIYK